MVRTPLIVVGIDGSPASERALEWAVHEALRRGATLQAVTAWEWQPVDQTPIAGTDPQETRAQAEEMSRAAVNEVLNRFSEQPTVSREVVEGRAADVLTQAARGADFLVVGSHGHGRLFSAVIGSVSQQCVRTAHCPVVIIPVPHEEREAHGDVVTT